MLIRHPTPDYTAGVWCYGDETVEDSDSDLTPACAICEGPVNAAGWCDQCEEQNDG